VSKSSLEHKDHFYKLQQALNSPKAIDKPIVDKQVIPPSKRLERLQAPISERKQLIEYKKPID
jgi:hypothetical protein